MEVSNSYVSLFVWLLWRLVYFPNSLAATDFTFFYLYDVTLQNLQLNVIKANLIICYHSRNSRSAPSRLVFVGLFAYDYLSHWWHCW